MSLNPQEPPPVEDQSRQRAIDLSGAAERAVLRAAVPALTIICLLSGAVSLLLDTGDEPLPGVVGFSFAALFGLLWFFSRFGKVADWLASLTIGLCWLHAGFALVFNPSLSAIPVSMAVFSSWWLLSGFEVYSASALAIVLLAIYRLSSVSNNEWLSTAVAVGALLVLSVRVRDSWITALGETVGSKGFEPGAQQELDDDEEDLEGEEDSEVELAPARVLEARGEIDGLWEWDLTEDTITCSPRWQELFGYEQEPLTNPSKSWLNLVHPHEVGEFMRLLRIHLANESESFELEHRMRQADDTYRWVLSRGRVVLDEVGNAARLAGTQIDLNREKAYEEQLRHQATHDRVTGLANREQLQEWLAEEAKRQERSETYRYAIALFQLEGLKQINDSLGHGAGDQVLAASARRLLEYFSADHSVARTTGDEFAVVLRGVREEAAAVKLAQEAEISLSRPVTVGGAEVTVDVYAGVAACTDADTDPEAVLRNADIAMTSGKRLGKRRVCLFDVEMGRTANRQFELQGRLRKAYEEGRFELFYQPILSAQDGRIICAEALMRLRQEDGGITPPGEFISDPRGDGPDP